MLTFIEFLEELERNHQTVTLPAGELERLEQKLGPRIRQMGFWNKASDGSLEIPMSTIAEAARYLDNKQLTEALHATKDARAVQRHVEHFLGGCPTHQCAV